MADYLLIASRDPYESHDVRPYYDLTSQLKARGNNVTVFLVQNGVLPARRSTASQHLTALSEQGVAVLADGFSLDERGIADDRLADGVARAPLSRVVDHLERGSKTLWA